MIKTLRLHIRGMTPLIMHNARLSDPIDPVVKEMKKIHGKQARNKTDEDHHALADLEWEGGLYVDKDGDLIIPAENVEGMLHEAAPKLEKGLRQKIKSGVSCSTDSKITHDGGTLEQMKGNPEFRLRKSMKVQKNRIMRTRPRIPRWEADLELLVDTSVIECEKVKELFELARSLVCLGDSRPKYGKFEITKHKVGN